MIADFTQAFRSLLPQCDEVYPICAHCQRLKLPCSLGAPEPSPDPTPAEKQLNLDDLQLLHGWCKGGGTKFCDHKEDDTLKPSTEIEADFTHPYVLHVTLSLAALISARQVPTRLSGIPWRSRIMAPRSELHGHTLQRKVTLTVMRSSSSLASTLSSPLESHQ